MKNIMTSEERSKHLQQAALSNCKVMDALMKTKLERTIVSIDRIERFMTAPTYADVELGLKEIKRIAHDNLVTSCKRISFICGEVKRFDGTELIAPIKNLDGSYKKVDEMTNSELMNMFLEFYQLDYLIKSACDEFAQ